MSGAAVLNTMDNPVRRVIRNHSHRRNTLNSYDRRELLDDQRAFFVQETTGIRT